MNKLLLAVLLSACAWVPAAAASDSGADAPASEVPAASGKTVLIADLPYSATQTLSTRFIRSDGSETTWQVATRMVRDSAGRTRRDTLDANGDIVHTQINDIDGAVYILHHADRTVSKSVARRSAPARKREAADATVMPAPASATAKQAEAGRHREPLGERDFEGVTGTGFLTTYAVRDGDSTHEVTTESWVSQELKLTLYHKRTSTRMGETEIALSDIDRNEPDAALFAVSADYRPLALK